MMETHVLVEHHSASRAKMADKTLTLGGQLHRGKQERTAFSATLRSHEMVSGDWFIPMITMANKKIHSYSKKSQENKLNKMLKTNHSSVKSAKIRPFFIVPTI